MDRHHLFLPLPPEAGICLLIHFQRPHQRKPDQDMTASLNIEAVSCTGRRDQTDLDLARVPVCNILIAFQVSGLIPLLRQVFPDTLVVVLEPVGNQHVLAVGLLDEIGQHLQLLVVNAKLYDVEPVTVRQWIRRGKLREAEKVGKEWRISELTDVPGRARYEPATYKWISRLKGIPEEFAFLSDYTNIDIRKRELNVTEADPEITFIAFLSSRAERGDGVAVRLTDAAKDRLEAYLIANPDVLFTGNTRTYAYKHEETIDEEGDENE